ncbi:protein-L-isoaspartate(D-aspartate) O-methyltransferase [Carboxylicivirga sediminis]|uniref:Protein-L-isoaspartate O-methyltransferase n=1 Tax=Carboxylicivirga sediminis TaxID=2006564 RepID=A0A941F212_9BACT|nr:protein-L-isoaspartate(D-aspartate) O-methyltransferase [Carboxylicivirga sediminis]MBR8534907.1 protein-L-isoaspartate(D-aspartate) O-methyltransferase [Carboxylicivirga sediminis]
MRVRMVEEQIISRGITDTDVIKALKNVPRHAFVPSELQQFAYEDRPLPIGYNQTISQPYIVAYMTELLNLSPKDKVLEIGTGSGYQAAILAEVAKEVYTIEIVKPLGTQATHTLDSLGYENVYCKIGDGYHGWEEHQPYDAIMLTAAPESIPEPLINQLKEGGSIIAPIKTGFHQQLIIYHKKNGKLRSKQLIAVRFVPFTREANKQK